MTCSWVSQHGRCISSSARAKTLEGIMSVCAVVPEGCEQLVVRSHATRATAVELKGEREVGWFWTQAKGHANMRFMGETVLQFLNRSDSIGEQRRLLIMTVDLLEAGGGDVIYSNDTHILADVCIRGLNESFGAKEEEDHSEGRHAQRLRDECRVLHVRVLEQLLLRPVFAADREACRKMAEVLLVLMDSSERDRQTERSLLPTGNIAQAAREAERVLSTHISVLDPPQ